jgi:hypothetical protein
MAGILSYPIGYRGLTLNGHYSAAGVYDRTKDTDTILVEQFDFSGLSVRDQREGLHLDTGGLLGPATKQFRRLSLRGSIRAGTAAALEDQVAKLFAAFDVEEAQAASPSTRGVHALDFYCPTAVSGVTSPVREKFLARPVGHPQAWERRSTGFTMAYALDLVCPDPRRYLYTPTSVTFSAAAGWTQTLPNWAAGMGAETMPVLAFDMVGGAGNNGHASCTVSDGTKSFVLDLSAHNADFTVNMQTYAITRDSDGASRAYLRTSSALNWLSIPAGGATWAITNTTNITKVVATYNQARS